MSERESRPGESGPFVSPDTARPSDEELIAGLARRRMEGWTTRPLTRTGGPLNAVPVTGGMSGGMYGTLLSDDIIPTGGGPRVDKIHGVLTDDPQLLSAVVKAIDGDDGAAVMIIAEKFRLSGVEAGEVLAAVLGKGERPVGCFLNKRGRLKVMATAEEMLRSLDRMSSAFHRTIPLDAFGVDPGAEKRVDAMMARHTADWKTYPLTLDTPTLTSLSLTMPSPTRPSGVRSLGLEEIDAVFDVLDQERRQTGENLEDYADTLAWMRLEVARLDAFESAFLVVNELCPPSDWLRALKAASPDPDALAELVQRATAARAEKDVAGAEDRHNCQTCAHGGRFTCNLFGSMRSEALTWRASNTTGDGCPGWEGKPTGEGFQTPSAPAQPSQALFSGDGASIDAQALRTSAQSFILADTCLDATAYEKGAHDAAMAILRGDLSKGDPRVTLCGQLVEAMSAFHRFETMHARLEAVMLAETGQRGLPGWVWDDSLPEDWTITFPGGCSASAWGRRGKTSAGFSVCRDRTITMKTDAPDALTAMEQATAWARARGYTEAKPDLEGTLSLEVRTGIAILWRGGCIPDAVEEYRNAFEAKGESMTYQEGRCALHMVFMPEPARVVVPAGPDGDDFIPV